MHLRQARKRGPGRYGFRKIGGIWTPARMPLPFGWLAGISGILKTGATGNARIPVARGCLRFRKIIASSKFATTFRWAHIDIHKSSQ